MTSFCLFQVKASFTFAYCKGNLYFRTAASYSTEAQLGIATLCFMEHGFLWSLVRSVKIDLKKKMCTYLLDYLMILKYLLHFAIILWFINCMHNFNQRNSYIKLALLVFLCYIMWYLDILNFDSQIIHNFCVISQMIDYKSWKLHLIKTVQQFEGSYSGASAWGSLEWSVFPPPLIKARLLFSSLFQTWRSQSFSIRNKSYDFHLKEMHICCHSFHMVFISILFFNSLKEMVKLIFSLGILVSAHGE